MGNLYSVMFQIISNYNTFNEKVNKDSIQYSKKHSQIYFNNAVDINL